MKKPNGKQVVFVLYFVFFILFFGGELSPGGQLQQHRFHCFLLPIQGSTTSKARRTSDESYRSPTTIGTPQVVIVVIVVVVIILLLVLTGISADPLGFGVWKKEDRYERSEYGGGS